MNKGELAAAVADRANLSKSQATTAVDAVFDVISERLRAGDEVRVLGFGNFSVASRAASTGRNPQTGEAIQIKASKQAKFKPGKGLKDAVNQ
jgi:DNA-binding protein HU-beta